MPTPTTAPLQFAIIGNGSFATALVKLLTHNGHTVYWWMRSEAAKLHLSQHHHNPHYLSQVQFDAHHLLLTNNINEAIEHSNYILLAVPSAFIPEVLALVEPSKAAGKYFVSAIKGIVPQHNILLNEYLQQLFAIPAHQYCCITGPCHAEEIAAEKLSYLTFSSSNCELNTTVAAAFATPYLRTVLSTDVYGVQYSAVLKNIYALGTGIAHGLDYGDNFLSVYNTNCFAEMKAFFKQFAQSSSSMDTMHHYITSAYLGDLLVTSYSLHSRNRTFGNMIGKGYSVQAAKLQLNMVAEGYYASKCIMDINNTIKAPMPIATEIYNILWRNKNAAQAFDAIEQVLQ
jgi:glycerol-3-phosphate dehydrogenase (NAD(P)+)